MIINDIYNPIDKIIDKSPEDLLPMTVKVL
jgi:hypothetical protein